MEIYRSIPIGYISLAIGFVFLLFSCKKSENTFLMNNKDDIFILAKYNKSKLNSKFSNSKLKNQGIYGLYNFIFYNDSTIYFFEDQGRFIPNKNQEATLVLFNSEKLIFISDSTKYPYIYLNPSKLKYIKYNELDSFLVEKVNLLPMKIKDNPGYRTRVSISIFKDSLQNKNFNKIFNKFKTFGKLNVRNFTTEEQLVAYAKFYNKTYNPKLYNWKKILTISQ